MSTLIEIDREIRALKSEGHRSTDAYVRVRPRIHRLERVKEEMEKEEQKKLERQR